MIPIPLTSEQSHAISVGEVVTTATVLLIFTIVILTVVAWKLFVSNSAKVTLPSGYKFEWSGA